VRHVCVCGIGEGVHDIVKIAVCFRWISLKLVTQTKVDS
jgi:hypothetical protein